MQAMIRRVFTLLIITQLILSPVAVFGQSIDDLEDEIASKESELDSISSKISTYQKRLRELSGERASLQNDIKLIENEVALAELDVEAIQANIALQEAQVQLLERNIQEETLRLQGQREIMKDVLYELQRNGEPDLLEVLLTSGSLNDFFNESAQIEQINKALNSSLQKSKALKETLLSQKDLQTDSLEKLEDLSDDLEARLVELELKENATSFLVQQTKNSESEYQRLVGELESEQRQISANVALLQQQLSERLKESGVVISDPQPSKISWPLDSYIMTATFHDPSYPFRNLWEHSGLDLAAPLGTPIKAAAPGIVAWTRYGNSYGNYVMIIHDNGLATMYAHMNSFSVSADQTVARGQVIGTVGSTGFSTGPHLHFEVRVNGIPVDPQSYLD